MLWPITFLHLCEDSNMVTRWLIGPMLFVALHCVVNSSFPSRLQLENLRRWGWMNGFHIC